MSHNSRCQSVAAAEVAAEQLGVRLDDDLLEVRDAAVRHPATSRSSTRRPGRRGSRGISPRAFATGSRPGNSTGRAPSRPRARRSSPGRGSARRARRPPRAGCAARRRCAASSSATVARQALEPRCAHRARVARGVVVAARAARQSRARAGGRTSTATRPTVMFDDAYRCAAYFAANARGVGVREVEHLRRRGPSSFAIPETHARPGAVHRARALRWSATHRARARRRLASSEERLLVRVRAASGARRAARRARPRC